MDTQLEDLKAIAPRVSSIRERVIELLKDGEALGRCQTDAEIAARYVERFGDEAGVHAYTTILARRSELVKQGVVVCSGFRRNPRTNVLNKVWALA